MVKHKKKGSKPQNRKSSHHPDISVVPLHIRSLAVDLRVILFTFLRGGNSLKFVLAAGWCGGCCRGALQRNANWPGDVAVCRTLDKQRCSNYTQLLPQMKRIKANESHTGQHRGCLMNGGRETEREVFVRRENESVCLLATRQQFCDLITASWKKKPHKKHNTSTADKQQLTMQRIMFTQVCINCRWLSESRRAGTFR